MHAYHYYIHLPLNRVTTLFPTTLGTGGRKNCNNRASKPTSKLAYTVGSTLNKEGESEREKKKFIGENQLSDA